jgi:hypothetical protein
LSPIGVVVVNRCRKRDREVVMALNVSMLLQIVRTLGVVLTEIGKLKALAPQQEAVATRGADPVELERQRLAQLQSQLEQGEDIGDEPKRPQRGRLDIGGTEAEGYEP